MKPYPDYKPSGVAWLGDVPGHWVGKRLRDCVESCSNGVWGDDPQQDENDIPVIRVADFDRLKREVREYETLRNVEPSQRVGRELSAGDMLIEKSGGGEQQPVGMVVRYLGPEGAVCSNFVARMAARDGICSPFLVYLHAYLYGVKVTGISVKQTTGIQNLDAMAYLSERCFVPPLDEQQAIADYLDTETARIDALIREKRSLIGLLEERRAGVFETLLSEVARAAGGRPNPRYPWLAVMPTEWVCVKVKHVVQSLDQGISPQCEARVPDEGEWGVLKVGCVNSSVFNANESKALPPEIDPIPEITLHEGDVLVSRANTKNLVGRAAMADKVYPKLMLSDKLYRIKLDTNRCVPAFLVGFLTLPAIRVRIEERATGASASMLNIDRRTIMDLDMPLPPIARQLEVVAMAKTESAEINALLSHVTAEIALLKELRAATIADAVLGRIDVRTHPATPA